MSDQVECPTCHGQGGDCPTCDGHGSIEEDVSDRSTGHRLELREEPDGLRHYLDDRPIHAGVGLEILLAGGTWVIGRYEWNFQRESWPLLYLELGGPWEGNPDGGPEAVLRIPREATLRWPRTSPFGDRL